MYYLCTASLVKSKVIGSPRVLPLIVSKRACAWNSLWISMFGLLTHKPAFVLNRCLRRSSSVTSTIHPRPRCYPSHELFTCTAHVATTVMHTWHHLQRVQVFQGNSCAVSVRVSWTRRDASQTAGTCDPVKGPWQVWQGRVRLFTSGSMLVSHIMLWSCRRQYSLTLHIFLSLSHTHTSYYSYKHTHVYNSNTRFHVA